MTEATWSGFYFSSVICPAALLAAVLSNFTPTSGFVLQLLCFDCSSAEQHLSPSSWSVA